VIRRLEEDALTDLQSRAEYGRVLSRQGEVRGDLLLLSVEPSRGHWSSVLDIFRDQIPPSQWAETVSWFEPWLSHWTDLDRVQPTRWMGAAQTTSSALPSALRPLCRLLCLKHADVQTLEQHTHASLQALMLWVPEFSVLPALDHLTMLKQLNIIGERNLSFNWYIDFEWSRLPEELRDLSLLTIMPETLDPIATLTRLEDLRLDECRVRDLTFLTELNHLDSLELTRTKTKDITALSRLPSLCHLDLSGNNIRDLSPLSSCQQLRSLLLGRSPSLNMWEHDIATTWLERARLGNPVRDLSPLALLTALEELDLSHSAVRNIEVVSKMPKLRWLGLHRTKITHFEPTTTLTHLEFLDLSNTAVQELGFCERTPHLTKLDLSGTRVRDLSPLKNLAHLNHLCIPEHRELAFSVEALKKHNPALMVTRSPTAQV